MSDHSSHSQDARMLFSPVVKEVDREPSTDAPLPDTSASDESEPPPPRRDIQSQSCFVNVPVLSSVLKAKYRSVAEDILESDEEFPQEGAERIVGEIREHGEEYYYVLYKEGVIYKVPARSFGSRNSNLLQEYESRANDILPRFDPSAPNVHPSSRPAPLTNTVAGRNKRAHRISADDLSSDELAHSEDSGAPPRRSSRAAATSAKKKLQSKLPFSPRKTRSAYPAISVHSSDSEDESQGSPQPTRRSTRVRTTRANFDDDDFDGVDSADDSYAEVSKKVVKKRIVRGKASRPAYGHFRVVADLLYDEEENEDIGFLLAHRSICEKCHTAPSHEQLVKPNNGRKRKATDESEDDKTRLTNLGGWVRCLKCPVAAHWGCLAKTQRDEILRAAHERDKAAWRDAGSNGPEPLKRAGLGSYQTTEFICGSCMKGGICMACKEVALRPDQFAEHAQSPPGQRVAQGMTANPSVSPPAAEKADNGDSPQGLLFRCFTCKRLAHYAHLPVPYGYDSEELSPAELADYYQHDNVWKCADCASYVFTVEHILAWRPYPANAMEPPRSPDEPPNYKVMLPREYLVKWVDRSYRRVQWVPHGWLLAVSPGKLKNFLHDGPKIPLLLEPGQESRFIASGQGDSAAFDVGREASETPQDEDKILLLAAVPDAEKRLPPAWRTVDRVLDILFWRPRKITKGKDRVKKGRVDSYDEEVGSDKDKVDPKVVEIRELAYNNGEEPPRDAMVTIEEFESLTREKLGEKNAQQVAWAFFKWEDLGYDDASWDSPPRKTDSSYPAFDKAFKRFIDARLVKVPAKNKTSEPDRGPTKWLAKHNFTVENQPDLGQDSDFKLMDFQVDGVNWLCHNWNVRQNCILADEMGLGKTVQIVTFIGYAIQTFKAYPALVVVPNSTLTNWVREFERWAPKLRVVPFYGEAKARDIIKKFELTHSHPAPGTTGAKYHVLVTTYETLTNTKEFGPVFKSTPRWEMLVVDEGQRLKNDESLIFRRLRELNSFHRIIMTGTPLNNNIRELFNLMNFLNPDEWHNLEALANQFEVLTDELVAELHGKLKPYFLRRIKSEVLHLPPKNEVIVPVSMAPLQKEIYRSILSQNLDTLRSLAEGNAATASKGSNGLSKTNMNNMLMQLRKCLQHPYLVSPNIEPGGMSSLETHERLVGASAKLRLLKTMLPKLRVRGHRMLLFSQFVIALDIIEDFLTGEGIKFLRLDGNTKQAQRQKDMDEFNKPDSDVSVFLLSTRAGGVGINLWSADTVIIFDPDFNPHQDLQAIARAHRYGQKKTVLVFKLMVKDSAEERIMQNGKKKLVLDHLIVQKMDDESGAVEDVQSILMFGAKALFEDSEDSAAREVHYSEHDIESLIEKTEKEGDVVEPASGPGSIFAFAKVWSAEKEGLEDLADKAPENPEEADSWAKALELIAQRNASERQKEVTGRGVRRKAAAVFPQQSLDVGDIPKSKTKISKKKSKGKATAFDDSDFNASVSMSDDVSDSDYDVNAMDVDDIQVVSGSNPPVPPNSHDTHNQAPHRPPSNIPKPVEEYCGLCATHHTPGDCFMTESPENLAQYRLMLMQHAGDETIEERRAAIRVIDETLHRLGMVYLIYGQPLHLVEAPPQGSLPQPPKKPKLDTHGSRPAPHVPRNVTANGMQPIAGSSKVNVPVKVKMPSTSTTAPSAPASVEPRKNAAASSWKTQPSIPTHGLRVNKAKETMACPVCGRTPLHLVKDCPVVAQGPDSIAAAIGRLSKDPAQGSLVGILQRRLMKLSGKAQAGQHNVQLAR